MRSLLQLGWFFSFFVLSWFFVLCLCACTLYTSVRKCVFFQPPLSILIPAIDIPPPICYSPPLPPPRIHTHARSRFTHPRHFLFRICFSSCMAQKPCATYAIYALAFNVSHPKSLFVTLLDCLLTTVLTAESRRQDTSGYTHTSQIDPWRGCSPHGRKPVERVRKGNELDGDRGYECVSVMDIQG